MDDAQSAIQIRAIEQNYQLLIDRSKELKLDKELQKVGTNESEWQQPSQYITDYLDSVRYHA